MAVDQTNSSRGHAASAPRPPRAPGSPGPSPTTALAWETILDLGAEPGPLHGRLENAVREAVFTGRVPPGAALPPSRVLADTLGVSRWVVTEAYGQLVAEGFLESRTGSGTRVPLTAEARPLQGAGAGSTPESAAGRATRHQPRVGVAGSIDAASADLGAGARRGDVRTAAGAGTRATSSGRGSGARARFDLGPGVPDLRHVPRAAWVRALREALAEAPDADLAAPDPTGHPATRAALADYLARARHVRAGGSDVVVTHGADDAMRRVAAALHRAGHRALLVEDPSWSRLRETAAAAGLTPVPVPVDADGIDVDALLAAAGRTGARAVLVTPAHQFPTGAALSPVRREALVRWARDVDGLVVEDDYDAEFRYDRRPVAAMQGLAPDRVVLLGSLSKTLSPAFGLGWAVLPPGWRDQVVDRGGAGPSTIDQLALARFLGSGAYERHLRAARGRFRRRREALVEALGSALPGTLVTGIAAGMHAVVDLPDGIVATDVVREAALREVNVAAIERYRATAAGRDGGRDRLVVGYGNLADARVEEAVARLAAAVRAAGR
ncbi:PLP-dependent aminotransferase family protein [Oerskovia jenensis]|uniref:GntR family transcriptional regulator/MocR family aminotransferase n=1 Tax=Oerskovia jenensis TaxID=162169 RepID=A0ABS2LCP2_9CELL|nr:PLP-dependent aminotransferase family protein [Oerskovia jenensis]MBM7478196.1 GntR family transcriptional regulator/MocR family aminotransferase [Oerskovia jenensis]